MNLIKIENIGTNEIKFFSEYANLDYQVALGVYDNKAWLSSLNLDPDFGGYLLLNYSIAKRRSRQMQDKLKQIETVLTELAEINVKALIALTTLQELQKTHVLVPREPTEEMILTGIKWRERNNENSCAPIYKAMIGAYEND